MVRGEISARPAPYIYIDGASLFERSFFGCYPVQMFVRKLEDLMDECNVRVFLERYKNPTLQMLEKTGFLYTEVVTCGINEIVKRLKNESAFIFAEDDRIELFCGRGKPLSATNQKIKFESYDRRIASEEEHFNVGSLRARSHAFNRNKFRGGRD